jgi:hypothetical protein
MTIEELPLTNLTVYGIIGAAMVPLANFSIIDESKRSETVEDLLGQLASEEKVIIGSTLIFTESYDAFRVV